MVNIFTYIYIYIIYIYERTYFRTPVLARGSHIFNILERCTCRMDLIRRALDRIVSQVSNARFSNIFGPFFTSLDDFEVTGHVTNRRNSDMDLRLIHVSFGENRENDFLLR